MLYYHIKKLENGNYCFEIRDRNSIDEEGELVAISKRVYSSVELARAELSKINDIAIKNDGTTPAIPIIKNAHFGTDDLDGAVPGVSNVMNTFTPVDNKHRFNIIYNIFKLPKDGGLTYDDNTGEIILREGVWLFCASADIDEDPSNLKSVMNLCYDGKVRHSTEIEPNKRASVSGIIISDGAKVSSVEISVEAKNNNANQMVNIRKAHLHAIFFGLTEGFAEE